MKYIQVFSEALLPLLGFLFWNWGLYFILLYYLLDLFADVIITHLKSKKIALYQAVEAKTWLKNGVIGGLLFISNVLLMHLAVESVFVDIDFVKEAISFWTYKDLGMQQGYVLIPLVAFAAYQQYKLQFVRLKQHETYSMDRLWRGKIIAYAVILVSSVAVILVSQIMRFDEAIYIYTIITITTAYQLIKDKII